MVLFFLLKKRIKNVSILLPFSNDEVQHKKKHVTCCDNIYYISFISVRERKRERDGERERLNERKTERERYKAKKKR